MSDWFPPVPFSNAPYHHHHPYRSSPHPHQHQHHAPPPPYGGYEYPYYVDPSAAAPANMPAYDEIVDDESAPDVIIIKNRGRSSTLHFPAYAIGDGILTVGNVRDAAAHQLDVHPPRRVKLLYKGRLLKDDDVPAKRVGLKQNSQVMCVVSADFGSEATSSSGLEGGGHGQHAPGGGGGYERLRPTAGEPRSRRPSRRRRGSVYDGDDDDGDGDAPRREPEFLVAEPPRNRRSRSPSSPRRTPANLSPSMGTGRPSSRPSSSSAAARSPSPARSPHSRPPTRPQGSPLAPLPSPSFNAASSSQAKIEILEGYFASVIEPACLEYIDEPPSEPKAREFEHRRLSETAMTQLLLKADEIKIEGDETARQRRKALIDRVHGLLKEVDDAAKR